MGYAEHTTVSACEALGRGSAIRLEARAQGGEDVLYDRGVLECAAMVVSHNFERPYDEVVSEWVEWAKHIFRSGQDYKRELALYDNVKRRMQGHDGILPGDIG
jgi:hypothetical protein